MTDRRDFLAAAGAGLLTTGLRAAPPAKPLSGVGVVIHSYPIRSRADRGFADPLKFLAFCRERGAAGVQLPLGTRDGGAIRAAAEKAGMYVEGSVGPPKEKADVDRFEAEIKTAREAGAVVVRTVMLGGRRYETFQSADQYREFKDRSWRSLQFAEPMVSRHKVRLAVENHKDYRADELADVMTKLSSEFVGVTVDTGNNVALLEDSLETARTLAPWVMACHLKDMGVEESADGFLLSEVPLGDGYLDLKGIVGVLKKARPEVRFSLEMITRDPLKVPCLSDGYWATFADVPGRDLARTIRTVRERAGKEPLPRIGKLPPAEQLAAEDRNVGRSLAYAGKELGL
jgi:sugar phosphate isomerase/epimerase